MRATVKPVIDRWIGRRARPDPDAVSAVRGLRPATVVTGASRGIGLALARRFAEAGDTVVLIARTAEPLVAAAQDIARTYGSRALPLALDVTARDAPRAIEAFLAAESCYLDRLINSAGVGLSGCFYGQPIEAIERLLALNVTAATRLMHHAIRPMRARGRGGILTMASLGGFAPGPHQAAYYASKGYLLSLTEAVANEIAGEGVRVSVVAPGPVQTGFHAAMGADSALYRRILPQSSPERVARVAYRGFILGRRIIVPGIFETGLGLSLRVLPHAITVPLISALLRTEKTEPATGRLQS